jgi:hypothetical protein
MSQAHNDNEISPDGVVFEVDLDRFTVGTSMFIPCINTDKAVRQIKKITKLTSKQLEYRVVIEAEKYGVRIWRVL